MDVGREGGEVVKDNSSISDLGSWVDGSHVC